MCQLSTHPNRYTLSSGAFCHHTDSNSLKGKVHPEIEFRLCSSGGFKLCDCQGLMMSSVITFTVLTLNWLSARFTPFQYTPCKQCFECIGVTVQLVVVFFKIIGNGLNFPFKGISREWRQWKNVWSWLSTTLKTFFFIFAFFLVVPLVYI